MTKAGILALGNYKGVAITASDNEYVNATQMCQACGKLWANYWQNDVTREFATALESDIGIPISQLVRSVKGNSSGKVQGTWIHRKMAIHLAAWLSPQFAVWCINRLDELFQTGSINREHAEHAMVIAAVDRMGERILGPMAENIIGITRDVQEVKTRLSVVEDAVLRGRKQVPQSVRRKHQSVLLERYRGQCACCLDKQLFDDTRFIGQIDHWFGRQLNGASDTWPICRSCNLRLRDSSAFKKEKDHCFHAYQDHLQKYERIRQPLLLP
jgi:hypothetical protein